MPTYNIELFQGLDESFKKDISRCSKLVEFKKGTPLFCKDELIHYFYIIISGKMKTYQLNIENAKEQTIFLLTTGDMLDTIILLDSKPHDVMHEALEDIQLLQIPLKKVREWIKNTQDFSRKFFLYLANQTRQIEELATDISLHNTSQRLIKILLQNIDPHNRQKYNLLNGLSHTEIANLIGTVRHVVERHLHKLVQEGIMDINHKHLFIKDIQKLLNKREKFN